MTCLFSRIDQHQLSLRNHWLLNMVDLFCDHLINRLHMGSLLPEIKYSKQNNQNPRENRNLLQCRFTCGKLKSISRQTGGTSCFTRLVNPASNHRLENHTRKRSEERRVGKSSKWK